MLEHAAEKTESKVTLGILLIILLGSVIYSNILYAPFAFDDSNAIKEKELIRNLPAALASISSSRYVTDITFAINYAAGNLNPFGYHLVNNMIHLINAVLVFFFVKLTLETPFLKHRDDVLKVSGFQLAFFSSLFFVAHPIQTQAVTYIVQRSTSMATMFYLFSLISYIKWRNQKWGKSDRIKYMHLYILSIIFAVFAMKTKEISFTLPIVTVAYEFLFLGGKANRDNTLSIRRRLLFLFPIVLTMLIIPLTLMNVNIPFESIAQDLDTRSRETADISREVYLLTEFRVIITYLRLLVFPINQNLDYIYPLYNSLFDHQVLLSFIFLLFLFCLAIYLIYRSSSGKALSFHHHSRLAAFGILWFFITLSVESSIIPIRDVIVEHRLYLPSVGVFIVFSVLTDCLLKSKKLKVAFIIAVIALLSIGTYSRNNIWKDPERLWQDVIAKSPENSRAYNNLGVVFKERGEFDKAIEQFEKSLKADRNYTSVYFNLGDVQYRLGNYENAASYLTTALQGRLDTQLHLDILNKLGRTYSAMGQNDKSIQTFQKAIQVMPSAIAPYNNLAVQYIKTGKFDIAIDMLEKGLEIRDEPYLRSNLSIAYAKKMESEKAIKK